MKNHIDQQGGSVCMNSRTDLIALISDMLQRANYREVNFVYVLLRAMLGEKETA